jgi:hypothetical protein
MAMFPRHVSLIILALLTSAASAQDNSLSIRTEGEWHFARLVYQGSGRSWRGSRFSTDYPEAEIHLRQGLDRLTRVQTGPDTLIELDDDDIMNYPWLYAVEVGYWYLDERDAALIREYLLRGGFLLVDDFWGTNQWLGFEESMRRVFPDRPIVEIDESDPLMTLIYDLDKSVQIPGRSYFRSGVTWQQDGYTPHWRGIYDDDGRLMVAINFNMDMGDAWEHADDPRYPEPFTGLAYRFAVNYVIYSMTH